MNGFFVRRSSPLVISGRTSHLIASISLRTFSSLHPTVASLHRSILSTRSLRPRLRGTYRGGGGCRVPFAPLRGCRRWSQRPLFYLRAPRILRLSHVCEYVCKCMSIVCKCLCVFVRVCLNVCATSSSFASWFSS